jgi:hypothetical protein
MERTKVDASELRERLVHAAHCCVEHGCKYGERRTCPVVTKVIDQKYPCEQCDYDTSNTAWIEPIVSAYFNMKDSYDSRIANKLIEELKEKAKEVLRG